MADTPKVTKNDAVNRFWASVEPYCAAITSDDLRVIEEMLKSYDEDTEYMKVPPLGIHYTQRWAEEDLIEEQSDGKCCVRACAWRELWMKREVVIIWTKQRLFEVYSWIFIYTL